MKRLVSVTAAAGLLVAAVTILLSSPIAAKGEAAAVVEAIEGYASAFEAKDLEKMAMYVHPDTLFFEGTYINRGWVDYRDNHIAEEMEQFDDFEYRLESIDAHSDGDNAWATMDYRATYNWDDGPGGDRDGLWDCRGVATTGLLRGDDDRWRLRFLTPRATTWRNSPARRPRWAA